MSPRICTFVGLLLLIPYCQAKSPEQQSDVKSSMFFTPNEQKQLNAARKYVKFSYDDSFATLGKLKLNAIFYLDRQHWAIWLNGRRISHDEKIPSITVHKVHQNQVHCTWQYRGQTYDVNLKPGQIFYAEATN